MGKRFDDFFLCARNVRKETMLDIPANVPKTIGTIVGTVSKMKGLCNSDGVPLAVAVGAALVREGNRELATAANDCWAASVTEMHRLLSGSVSVIF